MLVCEAAGYDVVIVETVGIGQSEVAVAGMVDFFLVLLQPGAGDELQGIKKGVLELADGLVVHKADGELAARRRAHARRSYAGALALLRPLSPALDAARAVRERAHRAGHRARSGSMVLAQRARARGVGRGRSGAGASRRAPGCGAWSRRACAARSARTRRSRARIAALEREVESLAHHARAAARSAAGRVPLR